MRKIRKPPLRTIRGRRRVFWELSLATYAAIASVVCGLAATKGCDGRAQTSDWCSVRIAKEVYVCREAEDLLARLRSENRTVRFFAQQESLRLVGFPISIDGQDGPETAGARDAYARDLGFSDWSAGQAELEEALAFQAASELLSLANGRRN